MIIRSITYFDFNLVIDANKDSEEWLQITQVNDIGLVGKEIRQKIIRLNSEKQRELFEMLKSKFEPK